MYWDWGRTKGLSQLNVKHNFVGSFVYDLPRSAVREPWSGAEWLANERGFDLERRHAVHCDR